MEFGRIKILRLSLLAAFSLSGLLGCASAFAASEDAGTSATLDAFILPEYRRDDNRLQCILYGDKAVNQGAFITLTNPLLDIVHDNIRDINAIANFQSLKLYSIDTPTKTIRDFWKGKEHCRAIVSSPTAVYDRTTKMLRGDAPVFFRSLGMDIDGVGFDLNEETKYIHIRSKVRVVVRPEYRREFEPGAKSGEKNAPAAEKSKTKKDDEVK